MTRKSSNAAIQFDRALGEARSAREEVVSAFQRELVANLTLHHRAITCSRGCTHCCYHPVAVSLLEGLLAYRGMDSARIWTPTMRERMVKAADQTVGLSFEIWLLSMTPCPMLDGGGCMIYDMRPATCRMCCSIGDPTDCHPHNLVSARGIVPRAEAVHGYHRKEEAILRRFGLPHATMPLPLAVLVAERVCSGVPVEDSMTEVLKEYGSRL